MSSTTTPSEDKLYLTEDLEGRLNPADLENPEPTPEVEPEKDFYASNLFYPIPEPELPPPIPASVGVRFDDLEMLVLDGSLQSLSFGHEGWLCTVTVDAKLVAPVVLKASRTAVSYVQVVLPDGSYQMLTNIDCTATFSYGTASFTVTSDEARYV